MEFNEKLISDIVKAIVKKLEDETNVLIPIGISNRHIHLCREDLDILFGKGYNLTKIKDLKQPGQYAAKEVITLKGEKGKIEKVRILGPLRDETQIEISLSDGFKLGVTPPIRESGDLKNSSPIEVIGPMGSVKKQYGTIAALRHIHMDPDSANKLNLCDKQMVDIEISGIRKSILSNVLIRVSDKFELEMHIDTDEANACNVKNGDYVKILDTPKK